METLPSLNTLQLGLIPNCSQEAEEELLSVLSALLVIAIGELNFLLHICTVDKQQQVPLNTLKTKISRSTLNNLQ